MFTAGDVVEPEPALLIRQYKFSIVHHHADSYVSFVPGIEYAVYIAVAEDTALNDAAAVARQRCDRQRTEALDQPNGEDRGPLHVVLRAIEDPHVREPGSKLKRPAGLEDERVTSEGRPGLRPAGIRASEGNIRIQGEPAPQAKTADERD